MARRGRFGRAPRSAPSLTNTLVAIAREMQNQRDQNIMDAWKNGGMFEGREVTDEVILSHWRGRLKDIDKNDPLYDTYKNAVTQYEYSIAESKMTARHAQGNASDGAMVSFYMRWAKKTPKNSEFHRQLLRDAGAYMQRKQASNSASVAAAKEKAYYRRRDNINEDANGYRFMIDMATELARQNGEIGAGALLDDIGPGAPGSMIGLIEAINARVRVGGLPTGPQRGDSKAIDARSVADPSILYIDPKTGEQLNGAAILKRLEGFGIKGELTLADWSREATKARAAVNDVMRLDMKTGHMTNWNNANNEREGMTNTQRIIGSWDIQAEHLEDESETAAIMEDLTLPPSFRMAAWDAFSRRSGVRAEAAIARGDKYTATAITGEINGDSSLLSLRENTSGYNNVKQLSNEMDNAGTKKLVEAMQDQDKRYRDMVAASDPRDPHRAVYTAGRYDEDYNFVPEKGGPQMGMSTAWDVAQLGPKSYDIPVDNPQGGGSLRVTVVPDDIMAVVRDATGKAVATQVVGARITVNVGGEMVTIYGHPRSADKPGGEMLWGDAFWDENVTPSRLDGSNLLLDMSGTMPTVGPDGKLTGPPPLGITVNPTTGEIMTVDAWTVLTNTNPTRFMETDGNAFFDKVSPGLAIIEAQADTNGAMKRAQGDPWAKQRFIDDVHEYAGDQQDENGMWMNTGNAADLAYGHSQLSAATRLAQRGATPEERASEYSLMLDKTKPANSFTMKAIYDDLRTPGPQGTRRVKTATGWETHYAKTVAQRAKDLDATGQLAKIREAYVPGTNVLWKDRQAGQFPAKIGSPEMRPIYTPQQIRLPTYKPVNIDQPVAKPPPVPSSNYVGGPGGSSSSAPSTNYVNPNIR